MSTKLFRLGRFSFRNKWWVIGAWIALLAILTTLVVGLKPAFSKDFQLPGTDGGAAQTQLEKHFPAMVQQQEHANTVVVVSADDGLVNHRAELDALTADLRGLRESDPKTILSPVAVADANPAAGAAVLGDQGRVGLIQVPQDIAVMELKKSDREAMMDVLAKHRVGGLQVEATGGAMQAIEPGVTAELIGFAVAFVVLIVAFGAVVAAFIPLVTALMGVGATMLLVTLAAEITSVNQAATGIVTMLGIAVAIDYALFIVSRYRSELARGGTREDAVGRAVGTAGSAVVFAGLTVAIAVLALTVIGIPIITQMGLGAAVAVALAVLGALTLIPAILGATGSRTFAPRIPWIKHAEEGAAGDSMGVKFGRAVIKRPVTFILISLAILTAAAIPMKDMQLGLDLTTAEEVPAQQLLARGFGEGAAGPIVAVVTSDGGDVSRAADAAVARIRALPGVANPQALTWQGNGPAADPNSGATAAMIVVTSKSAPSSTLTHDLVLDIRDTASAVRADGAELNVGGQTAIMADLSARLDRALIPYLLVVVGLAFLIMVAVFRSLWVPLIGTLGFIFSVLATFGITSAIFTDGAFGLVDHTLPLMSFLPIFLVGVVFGLAMDYQVFLMTRMREEYMHGLSAREAILAGYRHGSRVVTSAAIIMISVFAAFVLSPDMTLKMVGFALAVAVLFDAFLIRMIVVPATLALLGDRAWRLPKALDRLVPDLDIEGGAVRDRGVPGTVDDAGVTGEGGRDREPAVV